MSETSGNTALNLIKDRLGQTLNIVELTIDDQSQAHAGHDKQGASGGHFSILVISEDFDGKSAIERHRMIYNALGDAIGKEIHALSINAKTPQELSIEQS